MRLGRGRQAGARGRARRAQDRDHLVREYGYTQDPMNVISERILGTERTQQMLAVRYGKVQIEESERPPRRPVR